VGHDFCEVDEVTKSRIQVIQANMRVARNTLCSVLPLHQSTANAEQTAELYMLNTLINMFSRKHFRNVFNGYAGVSNLKATWPAPTSVVYRHRNLILAQLQVAVATGQ